MDLRRVLLLCAAALLVTECQANRDKHLVTSLKYKRGACPEFPALSSFDPCQYTGVWYEDERSFLEVYEEDLTCAKMELTQNGDGTLEEIDTGYYFRHSLPYSLNGTNFFVNVQRPAKMVLKRKGSSAVSPPYEVVATDYSTWAVLYGCQEMRFPLTGYLWHSDLLQTFTRQMNPSSRVRDEMQRAVDAVGLTRDDMKRIPQNNCKN